jgi:hypothetical protein
MLTEEEFALAALSNDTNYDACYLSSQTTISHNLRDKGNFYPLNEVPGVMEYLDQCFPYVKEAATDEEGNIWMLPIEVDIDVMLIQKENCEKEDLLLWEANSPEELYEMVEGIDNEKFEHGREYNFNNVAFRRVLLNRYFQDHQTVDTAEFRELCTLLKRTYQLVEPDFGMRDMLSEYVSGNASDLLFYALNTSTKQTSSHLLNEETLTMLPVSGSEKPYMATCIFLAVNPSSDNLENTLKYITALSGYLMTLRNSGLTSDISNYTDSVYMKSFYETYQDAVITFELPGDIYRVDFQRYVDDEIELEELIREVDRKLDIYLNE